MNEMEAKRMVSLLTVDNEELRSELRRARESMRDMLVAYRSLKTAYNRKEKKLFDSIIRTSEAHEKLQDRIDELEKEREGLRDRITALHDVNSSLRIASDKTRETLVCIATLAKQATIVPEWSAPD